MMFTNGEIHHYNVTYLEYALDIVIAQHYYRLAVCFNFRIMSIKAKGYKRQHKKVIRNIKI
jgi:hypothetical protein